jgi:hypothetical protein
MNQEFYHCNVIKFKKKGGRMYLFPSDIQKKDDE